MSAVQFPGLIALLRVSMITITGCALAAAGSAAPQTAVTQAASRSAAFWRASAIDDVEAAYRMLREDHPGAAPEVGDGQFQKTLEEAHTLAASGALQVDSFAGYAATLARFANAFGDKHVRSRPVLEVAKPDWAGLIVSRRGAHWIVADAEQGSPAGTLLNAQLISCDGRTPDDWGAKILGHYRVDWSVDAQRIQAAPWLLISEGNPFVPRRILAFLRKRDSRTVALRSIGGLSPAASWPREWIRYRSSVRRASACARWVPVTGSPCRS
jgi:hypothetical protein